MLVPVNTVRMQALLELCVLSYFCDSWPPMDVFAPRDEEQGSIHAVVWNKTSVASLFVSHLNAPIDQDKLYLSAL